MAYKVYRYNNYFVVIDRGNYFEEHCENVLVTKKKGTDSVYTIAFLAQNTERATAISQSFPNISFSDIRDEFDAPYGSITIWEDWYTKNTGVGYITTLLAASGLATEATLFQILNNMIASQDVEILLVRDQGNADKVVQQIREYDQGTGVWTTRYEDVDGSAYVPVGPLEYLDPSAVLNLVLAELINIGVTLDDIYNTINLQDDDNSIVEGLKLPTQIVELYGHWSGSWQRLTTDGSNRLVIAADSLPLPTGAATQATLASVLAELQSTLDVNVTNATLAVTQSGAWTVTANQGTSPWIVGGTVALDAPTLAALETITVNQGTNPWTVNGTVNAAQSGTWTVALDVATLAALETITVQQGTTPWVVSGTVALDAPTLSALENITIQNGPGAAAVNIQDGGNSITVDDGGSSLTVDGSVSVTGSVEITNDVGNPIPVTVGNVVNVNLDATDDQVGIYGYVNGASGSPVPLNVNASGVVAIQDNGGSITVDGTVTALPSGTQDVNIVSGITLEVNLDQTNDQVQVYGSDLIAPIATDTNGHLQVDILTAPEIEIKNDVGNPIPISDAGGSITIDGTIALDAPTLAALESITVQNGAGAAAVNIQDGGNSITVDDGGGSLTVDGTVTANQGTSPWVVSGTVTATPTGTQDVNIVSGVTLEVNLDQNNDQVQVYGSDLIAPIATDTAGHLQVDILTIPEVEIKNDSGNPVPVNGTVALDATTLTALENITVQNGAGASAVNIQDGGNSITVDGTVNVGNFPASIEVSNDVGNPLPVSGTVAVTQSTSPWVVGDGGGSITVDGTVAATQSGTWNIAAITGPVALPTGAATETTLSAVNTKLVSVVRTPNLLRATGAGTIAPVVYDFSVANVGAANGTILGGTIKPGETLNFSAGTLNNSYAASSIAYDGTGTELVIIYNS